ncbi:hypothetical protein [Marinobacter sp. KMM 10035]|uniref:hypothetical protein n=1 Tax=Marinobacter sp. KMM 10035 TaxID=3134034 RepID=UPI00397DA0B1
MTQTSKVAGIVQINGAPAQRKVRAFGYGETLHQIGGADVTLSKSLGHATSDGITGEYSIDLLGAYEREVFVVAFDDYGAAFTPELVLSVGDRIHPTTPNGHVFECTGAGTLPAEEPAWVVDTETSQTYGTAAMIARPFYRPMVHGPVTPEVVGIDKTELLAVLNAASGLDSSAYTPGTWATLSDAVQAGQAVYDDPAATQGDVDLAVLAINDAITGLASPPPAIGEELGGGFYAGDIEDGGKWYRLVVADIEADVGGLKWMEPRGNWPQATSDTDGLGNTLSMAGDIRFEAGNYCLDYRGGGFDDWYMPARDELRIVYESLGHDRSPPARFEGSGDQAFTSGHYYWSSTQFSPDEARTRRFSFISESRSYKHFTNQRVRPIRRVEFTPEP